MSMGKQRLTDKAIRPLSSITSITPASVIPDVNRAGFLPIGSYKGVPAFWDLDAAVNQPLVVAEQAHILGILDGRIEGYDLKTLTTVVGATSPSGTVLIGTLTVPANQVWFIAGVQTVVNCTGAKNGLTANWKCSLWTDDAATPSLLGKSFWTTDLTVATTVTTTTLDEFGPLTTAWKLTNKVPLLRVPAGYSISLVIVTTTAQVDVAAASTLSIYGTVGKLLVK